LENLSKKHIKEIKTKLKDDKEEDYRKQFSEVCEDIWEKGGKDSTQLCLCKLFWSTQPNDRETVIEG
jgi:hypothetical protein